MIFCLYNTKEDEWGWGEWNNVFTKSEGYFLRREIKKDTKILKFEDGTLLNCLVLKTEDLLTFQGPVGSNDHKIFLIILIRAINGFQ